MKARRAIALIALLSFAVMLISSIVLYIVPQGRVAYWADWTLLGLGKEQWGAIHTTTGFLWLFTLSFHLYFNWRAITSYLKTRAKEFKLFTGEFNLALIVVLLTVVGTYAQLPPFSWVLDLGHTIKESAAETYGEPPYGHAEESSLKSFSQRMNLDLPQSLNQLKAAGFMVSGEQQTIKAIARANGLSPQQVVKVIMPEEQQLPGLPEQPQGMGRLTLNELCQKYQLDCATVQKRLKEQGIEANLDLRLKDTADEHQMSPHELFERVKGTLK